MGVMIVSVIGCLDLMCEVIRVWLWCSAGSRDLAADGLCLQKGLGHERVLVSMFCCDVRPLVRPVGQIVAGTLCLLVLC